MTSWIRRVAARSPLPPWASFLLVGLLVVVSMSHDELAGWALAAALLAPVVGVAVLGPYPVVALGVCAVTSVTVALSMTDNVPVWSSALCVAVFVISLLAGRGAPKVAPALGACAAGVALDVVFGLVRGEVWGVGALLLGLTVALPWLLGRSAHQQAELVVVTAERAMLQERARIAHDMHDTLGHELSLLALRAGALEMASDLDERHRRAAAELREGAGLATERLAEVLALLRDGGPAPLSPAPARDAEDVQALVDRASGAGLPVSLEWHGVRHLPPVIGRVAHRVVQEALTNAAKHAAGEAVRVRLATSDGTTVLTVVNPLPRRVRRGAGGGAGLAALREHVPLHGGTFRAGPRGEEFEVVATLPHVGES
ncbi:sensor histidine kinase [Streptosporangium sp. NPDC001559]|uniref:sensor histidine kinase n=1 Tax=Streptosporangium sp. NPDC001559 TaxID=3366187 RepID=UPI0036F15019